MFISKFIDSESLWYCSRNQHLRAPSGAQPKRFLAQNLIVDRSPGKAEAPERPFFHLSTSSHPGRGWDWSNLCERLSGLGIGFREMVLSQTSSSRSCLAIGDIPTWCYQMIREPWLEGKGQALSWWESSSFGRGLMVGIGVFEEGAGRWEILVVMKKRFRDRVGERHSEWFYFLFHREEKLDQW